MGGRPTLYDVGVVDTLDKKVSKKMLNLTTAMRTIIQIIKHKLSKPNPNIDDMFLLLESKTGSGKSSSFPVDLFRTLFNEYKGFNPEQLEEIESYSRKIDGFDMTIFDFEDDKYTKANKKENNFVQFNRTKHKVFVTQPKILTAKSKAEEIASEPWNPDLELGYNVGYSTSTFKVYAKNSASITYATLGTLDTIFKMKTDKEIMESFDICIVDECHIQSSSLMVCMRSIVDFTRRVAGTPGAPIFIFTSATFDVQRYADYLGTSVNNSVLVRGGETKYKMHFLDKPSENYIQSCIETAWNIHVNNPDDPDDQNDIMIFMTSASDIKSVVSGLNKLDTKNELIIYTLSGTVVKKGGKAVALIESIPLADVKKYEKRPTATRRITVTTSVAETGITVQTLKNVIISGYTKTTSYSSKHDLSILLTKIMTKSSATQQAGRVGRKFPGNVYFMFTEDMLDKLQEYEYPDTYSSDISKELLDVLNSNVPPSYINDPMSVEKFISFHGNCLNTQHINSSKENLNCKNIYTNSIIKKSDVSTNDDFMCDGSGIKLLDHPPSMLYNFPRDSYLVSRAKLIRLGLYGTYPGYLASKMPRLSTEGAKMLLVAGCHGLSIYDACVIVSLLEMKGKRYQVSSYDAQQYGIQKYDRRKISSEVVPTSALLISFGNITNMMDSISDDFVEFMIVMRFICKKMASGDYKKFKKVCSDFGLRDDIICEHGALITMFLDMAKTMGLENKHPCITFESDLMNSLARIKSVVYSGLRCNSAILIDGHYQTATGLKFKAKGMVGHKPKKIVYAGMLMQQSRNSPKYESTASIISSLDGWF